jgi:hypothetical protein
VIDASIYLIAKSRKSGVERLGCPGRNCTEMLLDENKKMATSRAFTWRSDERDIRWS